MGSPIISNIIYYLIFVVFGLLIVFAVYRITKLISKKNMSD